MWKIKKIFENQLWKSFNNSNNQWIQLYEYLSLTFNSINLISLQFFKEFNQNVKDFEEFWRINCEKTLPVVSLEPGPIS